MNRWWMLLFLTVPLFAERQALVIGNSDYQESPLVNPANDAKAIAETLRTQDFQVLERYNLSSAGFKAVVEEFAASLNVGDTALVFYAGHGVQILGHNYLVPVDLKAQTEGELTDQSLSLDDILSRLQRSHAGQSILVIDACRDNPFASKTRSLSRGLGVVRTPNNTLVAYSTGPGQVASDGDAGHGLFTSVLLKYLKVQGLEVNTLLTQVRREVASGSEDKQIPFVSSSLTDTFYLNPAREQALAAQSQSQVKPIHVVIPGMAGTSVYVNGLIRGTDVASVDLAPGTYNIELSTPGYQRWQTELTIDAQSVAQVSLSPEWTADPNRLLIKDAQAALARVQIHTRQVDNKTAWIGVGSGLLGGGLGSFLVVLGMGPFGDAFGAREFIDTYFVPPYMYAGIAMTVVGAVATWVGFSLP